MADEAGRSDDIDLEEDFQSLVHGNAERTGQGGTDQAEAGRSNDMDLEEDFHSLVHGNAERTGQGGTDKADASASARELLYRIRPGTLTEYVARHKTFQKYEWDKSHSFPKAVDIAEAGLFYAGSNAIQAGRSDDMDLEEDFHSLVHGNAERTGQGGTDKADASASARELLYRIRPGTLTEYVARHKTFQKYEWDKSHSFPKAVDIAEAGLFYAGSNAIQAGRSDDMDLEEDFHSLVHGNAERTGQGGTDKADASASARELLYRIRPGTLTEYVARHKTFQKYEWDKSHSFPKAVDIAEAGLFYAGKGDKVTCQYCGVELSNWEPDDDPFIEHKKRNPECPYIKQF